MEELQDAIEDAQYMNAMNDSTPRPTKAWQFPSNAEIADYVNRLMANNPRKLQLEGVCEGSLGFFMFTQYLKTRGETVFVEFLLDIAEFRRIPTNSGAKIVDKYLRDTSSGTDITATQNDSIEDSEFARPNDLIHKLPALPDYLSVPSNNLSKESRTVTSSGDMKPLPSSDPKLKSSSILPVAGANDDGINVISSVNPSTTLTVEAGLSPNQNDVTEKRVPWELYIGQNPNALSKLGGPFVSKVINDMDAYLTRISEIEKEKMKTKVSEKGEKANVSVGNKFLECTPRTMFDDLDWIIFSYLKDSYEADFKNSSFWNKYLQFMQITERKVCDEDFTMYRVLGRGGFGLVNACKRGTTGKLYAMKMMNKKRVKMKKSEDVCLNERKIMAAIDSPFVVCLKYAFMTKQELYLILDLMTGGDLGFHLGRRGKFSSNETMYYSARIIMGIAALHEKNIVYRDLKPENVLMDEHGYTKISDFGLARKVGKGGVSGCCGTRGYWAPEMLKRDAEGKRLKYTLSVDWFSLGCCMYEFMYGISPFRTEEARNWVGGQATPGEKLDGKSIKDRSIDTAIQEMEPMFDESFSEVSKSLLRGLLNKDGSSRLGAKGVHEIMNHPYFSNIDWKNLNQMPPPLIPPKDLNMATQSEIGVFADEKAAKNIQLLPEDHKKYEDWEFISIRAFEEEVVEFLKYEDKYGPIKPDGVSACCSIS